MISKISPISEQGMVRCQVAWRILRFDKDNQLDELRVQLISKWMEVDELNGLSAKKGKDLLTDIFFSPISDLIFVLQYWLSSDTCMYLTIQESHTTV